MIIAQIPEGQEGHSQGELCGERCEWNEERTECEKIDIIGVVSGREKEHRSPEMSIEGRESLEWLEHSKREEDW